MLGGGPSHLGQGEVALKPTAYGPWAYTVFREMILYVFFCFVLLLYPLEPRHESL